MAKRKRVDPTSLVKLFGSNVKTAKALGVSKQAVGKWILRQTFVPEKHHIRIANLFPVEYGHLLRG